MQYSTYTIQGHRPYNEDRVSVKINLENENKDLRPINYYAIFDGHGGNGISEYLSKELDSYIMKSELDITNSNYNKYIINTFNIIQTKLTNYNINSKLSGSTALICIIYYHNKKKYLKVVNLGDCRAIMCNNDYIAVQLSLDHKPMAFPEYNRIKLLKGKITQDEGDDPRVSGMAVSRAFGDLDAKPYVTHTPEIYEYPIKNDKFIVIGCDGLWDVLSNQEVIDFVLFLMKKTKDLKKIAKKLVNHALEKGSQDNITVIIINF